MTFNKERFLRIIELYSKESKQQNSIAHAIMSYFRNCELKGEFAYVEEYLAGVIIHLDKVNRDLTDTVIRLKQNQTSPDF